MLTFSGNTRSSLAALQEVFACSAFAQNKQLDRNSIQTLIDPLYHLHWNVFARPPFAGQPEIVPW